MRVSTRALVVVALALAVGLAVAVSPYASSSPDGLNRVAGDKGFDTAQNDTAIQESSPIPGYAFPGIENEKVAKGVAGFVGTIFVFGAGYGIAYALRRRAGDPDPPRRAHGAAGSGA